MKNLDSALHERAGPQTGGEGREEREERREISRGRSGKMAGWAERGENRGSQQGKDFYASQQIPFLPDFGLRCGWQALGAVAPQRCRRFGALSSRMLVGM